jgi:Aminotransferase class I and II
MNPHGSTPFPGAQAGLESRPAVRALPRSKIREIANAGFGKTDLVKFWFGESDVPTPDFIKAAAVEALDADAVFYSHNNGVAPLRETLAAYLTGLHGRAFEPARISVTSSGVSALMIAMQALVSPGDEVVVVTPVWPNVSQIPAILPLRRPRKAGSSTWIACSPASAPRPACSSSIRRAIPRAGRSRPRTRRPFWSTAGSWACGSCATMSMSA